MNTDTVETIGIAVLVIAFITVRQSVWQTVNLTRLLRMPVIFGLIGVVSLVTGARALSHLHVGVVDVLIIGTELALGLLAGWLMGRFTQIRRFGDQLKSRLGAAGIGVWLGFLVVRIGLAVVAHVVDAGLAEQTGTILIVVAVIKTVQALMIRERIDRHQAAERQREYAAVGF